MEEEEGFTCAGAGWRQVRGSTTRKGGDLVSYLPFSYSCYYTTFSTVSKLTKDLVGFYLAGSLWYTAKGNGDIFCFVGAR